MNITKASSPFISLLKIRNQFGESENLAIESVNELITGATIENLDKEIIGASGLVYSFQGSTRNARKIATYVQSGSDLVKQSEVMLSGDLTDAVLQDIESVAVIPEGIAPNVANIVQDICDGAHFNGVLSEIAGAFMGSHALSMSDISSLLTAHNLGSTNDLNALAKILYQNANDGKVNVYSFLATISSLCSNSKTEVDDGALEMDTTKPLIIQSILATVKMFSSLILSTILSVLSAALGGILRVLAGLLSTFFSVIGSVGSDTLSVNLDSVSGLLDGPIQYLETDEESSYPNLNLNDNPAGVYKFGPIEQYIWKNNGHYYNNSFINLTFDFAAFSTKVYQNKLTNITNISAKFNNFDDAIVTSSMQNGMSEVIYCMNDPSYATKKLALELAIIASMGQFPYYWNGSKFKLIETSMTPSGSGSSNRVYFQNCFHSSVTTVEEFRRRSIYFVREILFRHIIDSGTIFDEQMWIDESGIDDADAMNYIQKFYSLLAPVIATQNYIDVSELEAILKERGETQSTYQCDCVLNALNICIYADDNAMWLTWLNDLEVEYSNTDRLPCDRTFGIPAISGSTALKTFLILAGVTIAASAALTVTGKALKKRKFIKQLKAKENLSTARKNYVDSPTSENLDAFYKAQKSYNFKAKIFGWSTYDATNDWFNDASGASGNNSNTTNPVTDTVLYNLIHG